MLSVSVYKSDHSETIQARCVFDTGCTQGNLISLDLAQRLGFAESDFLPLSARESNGGMVATGDIHQVAGAVRISWFHNTSPKVFNDMRFLVSKSAQIDLVVGTGSIVKENLLTRPNLKIYADIPTDPDREKLVYKKACLEAKVKKAEIAVDNAEQGSHERREAEEYLMKKDRKLKVATVKLELYQIERSLRRQNSDRTRTALFKEKQELESELASMTN